jgi:ATP-dependent DNA ligase
VRRELVCEVEIEHVSGGRIRHGARFQRWRDDKPPAECTVDQIDR